MEKYKSSLVLEIILKIWQNLDYSSHQRVNSGIASILCNIIEIGIHFEKTDIKQINKSFRGNYWFGVSSNGKTNGEQFYRASCGSNPNVSEAQSFEYYRGRKPFILENHRLYEGIEFKMDNLYYKVTGFDDEKELIYAVGYTSMFDKGKKKLIKLTNDEFLIKRKSMKLT